MGTGRACGRCVAGPATVDSGQRDEAKPCHPSCQAPDRAMGRACAAASRHHRSQRQRRRAHAAPHASDRRGGRRGETQIKPVRRMSIREQQEAHKSTIDWEPRAQRKLPPTLKIARLCIRWRGAPRDQTTADSSSRRRAGSTRASFSNVSRAQGPAPPVLHPRRCSARPPRKGQ